MEGAEPGLTGEDDDEKEAGPALEKKDYLALAIAALETVLLPLVILIIVLLVLLLIFK